MNGTRYGYQLPNTNAIFGNVKLHLLFRQIYLGFSVCNGSSSNLPEQLERKMYSYLLKACSS